MTPKRDAARYRKEFSAKPGAYLCGMTAQLAEFTRPGLPQVQRSGCASILGMAGFAGNCRTFPAFPGTPGTARKRGLDNGREKEYKLRMSKRTDTAITDALRRAINESGKTAYLLEKETGVFRGSIIRFARGEQSITLDLADRLAAHLGVTVNPAPRKQKRAKP